MPEYDQDVKTNVKIAAIAMIAILIYFTLSNDGKGHQPPPRPIEIEQVK